MTVSNTNKAVSGLPARWPTAPSSRPTSPPTPASGHDPRDQAAGAAAAFGGPGDSNRSRAPGTGYLVVLTNGIQMAAAQPPPPDTDYATIKTTLGATINPANCATLPNAPMQGACGFTASHLAVAANPALGPLSARSREHHRLVPLLHRGDTRHAARAGPDRLQPGGAGPPSG